MKNTVMLILALAVLAACNTFNGMGQDLQSAGQGISNSAQSVKQKINSN